MRQPSDREVFGNRPGGSLPIPSPRPLPSSQCVDAPRGPVCRPATQKASPGLWGGKQGHKERLKLKLLFFSESGEQRDGQGRDKGIPLGGARRQAAGWRPTNAEKWEKKRQQ